MMRFNAAFNGALTDKETTLIKFIIFTSLISLGGMPPFLGFLPKFKP